ncbi:uncharacterized protein LOC129228356 [Uloborus diversus]|uniref:uncharacterized protein LOC129228356 n=1 Tax=Uloborus diversus TaxID=327109 RepID=UPI002409477D|nr:uncharacterized protein LOC129228356 [Uloborus diversus]
MDDFMPMTTGPGRTVFCNLCSDECLSHFVSRNKNLENVIGSFYSEEDLPQYCYTIFSLWGKPEGKRDKIPKGAKLKFLFNLNATRRPENTYDFKPRFNLPLIPSVQIAVHSPYFLPSPYSDGVNYPTGRAYTLRITMEENHLLPSPYQTNCTNYLEVWRERNGKAPINPLGEVQECRVNQSFKQFGCVPVFIDYPHEFDICSSCTGTCQNGAVTDECILLTDKFNQPCEYVIYFLWY